jgi:inosine-uridine nucleoside N-ribohydrolase
MAILFALAAEALDVIAVTAVGGNIEVEKCARNALKVLEIGGRTDIPVAKGAGKPLLRPPKFVYEWHGRDGLGDIGLSPPSTELSSARAVDLIIDTVLNHPRPVTLISLGPLTNLALALSVEPAIADNIEEIIWMGGAAIVSDLTDFNLYHDPEAAKVVLHAGVPFTMVGLDVTWEVIMEAGDVAALQAAGSAVTDFLVAIIQPYWEQHKRHGWGRFGRKDPRGFNIHDAVAVAYAIAPELFMTQKMYASVLIGDMRPSGLMYADKYGDLNMEPNINACIEVNGKGVVDLFVSAIVESFGHVG